MRKTFTIVLTCALLVGVVGAEEKYKSTYGKKVAKAGYAATPLTEADKATVASLFDEMVTAPETCAVEAAAGCGESTCTGKGCEPCYDAMPASNKLAKLVAKRSDGWDFIEPMIVERFHAAEATDEERGRMVTLVAWQSSKSAMKLGEKLYKAAPQSFQEEHVLAFAERGSKDFTYRLEKLVLAYGEGKACGSVRPAAFLAFHGVDVGRDALATAAGTPDLDVESVDTALLSAAALANLGEKKVWHQTQRRVHDAVLNALDDGKLEQAQQMALRAEFAYDTLPVTKGARIELSSMGERVGWHCKERSTEVATADQIFELIERITPM